MRAAISVRRHSVLSPRSTFPMPSEGTANDRIASRVRRDGFKEGDRTVFLIRLN